MRPEIQTLHDETIAKAPNTHLAHTLVDETDQIAYWLMRQRFPDEFETDHDIPVPPDTLQDTPPCPPVAPGLPQTFGEALRGLRNGTSPQLIADELHMNVSNLFKLEANQHPISERTLDRLLDRFRLSVAEKVWFLDEYRKLKVKDTSMEHRSAFANGTT